MADRLAKSLADPLRALRWFFRAETYAILIDHRGRRRWCKNPASQVRSVSEKMTDVWATCPGQHAQPMRQRMRARERLKKWEKRWKNRENYFTVVCAKRFWFALPDVLVSHRTTMFCLKAQHPGKSNIFPLKFIVYDELLWN